MNIWNIYMIRYDMMIFLFTIRFFMHWTWMKMVVHSPKVRVFHYQNCFSRKLDLMGEKHGLSHCKKAINEDLDSKYFNICLFNEENMRFWNMISLSKTWTGSRKQWISPAEIGDHKSLPFLAIRKSTWSIYLDGDLKKIHWETSKSKLRNDLIS